MREQDTIQEIVSGPVTAVAQTTFAIKRYNSEAEAGAAIPALLARGGQLVEGLLSKTSDRWQFATTSLVEMLVEISVAVQVDKAKLKMGESTDTQRPVDPPHVKEIVEYFHNRVTESQPYWFGQLAFNLPANHSVTIVTINNDSPIQKAYMVIPKSTKMLPVDGNHRLSAFLKIMAASAEGEPTWDALKTDAIQWCLIDEPNPEIARQLFVDAGQSKPLPPALLVGFAALDVLPSVVKRIALESHVFKRRIDYLSKSLGRDHRVLLTINQLRIVTAEFLFGRSDRKGVQQETTAIAGHAAQDRAVEDATEFFESMAKAIGGPWQQLLDGESLPLADLREQRVDFTTSGLQAIARLGHDIWKQEEEDRVALLERLGDVNFSRSNEFWIKCGLVIPTQSEAGSTTYRIGTQSGYINGAYEALRLHVGLHHPFRAENQT